MHIEFFQDVGTMSLEDVVLQETGVSPVMYQSVIQAARALREWKGPICQEYLAGLMTHVSLTGVTGSAAGAAVGAIEQDPLILEYGFKMTPTDESQFPCGVLEFHPNPGQLRRTVADQLNPKLLTMGYSISDWLLERSEMNRPFDEAVVSATVGKDSNWKTRRAQKIQMGENYGFTNRAEWALLLAFHRLATQGSDRSLEQKAFRTDPGAVWSDARGARAVSYWVGNAGDAHACLFAARSRTSGS